MVCEQKIKELERRLKRKLTPKEKAEVERKMHHNELGHHNRMEEEECIPA
jgi:hypothetical protein